MKAIRKRFRVLAHIQLVCALALAGAFVYLPAHQALTPPPFEFTQAVYAPDRANLCPGDLLEWRPSLTVNRAPTVLAVSRTIWDATRHRTVVPDSQLDFYVWTEQEIGRSLDHPLRFPVPDLPAGVYELRAGASAFNSDSATYRVPFAIPSACFQKGQP